MSCPRPLARAPWCIQGMSSSSTEDGAPGKRRLQSPEEGAGPASWVVKRQRSGALIPGSNELQRSERHTGTISPAPSAGGSAGTGASPKPKKSQTSARPFTCQVEDCTRDVCELSTYHFRYRICNVHIRLPAFMRQGKLQRFCQQCGRCHELSEFEGNQRSCRAQLDRHNARRRQAKKNAQAAKKGGAGHSVVTSASQPLSNAHQYASASREAPRAFSADLEHYHRARAIRPVGKLGQTMPAAEAAALLTAAANGQPRFALGSATSAFGQYNEASAAGASQHSGSRYSNLGAQTQSRQLALFKRDPHRQESEESMSQQPQISSSSSEGAGQTAEASAALQSLYKFAGSSQQDGASSRAPGLMSYRRPEKAEIARPSPGNDQRGNDRKTTLSPRMREQAAAVAAELSARTPAEGVAKTAPLTHSDGKEEGLSPAGESAVHPKLRQKTGGSSRAAAMISTWQQHSDNSSSAQLAGLPALASAAAAAQSALEGAGSEPEQAEQPPDVNKVAAQRVDSNAQSDPIEPQPTPFEAYTQAPLSTERPEAVPPKAKMQGPEVCASVESSAMGLTQLSRPPSDVRTASIRTGGTGSMASRSMSDSLAVGRSMDSSAPTDSSAVRGLAERNAQLLGFLHKNHLLETSQAMAAMPAVGSAALSAALGQRAASTQSSMDVLTAENIAASLPELTQSLQEPAGRGPSPLAPAVSSVSTGKPPAFPQGQRSGRLASVTEEEEPPLANEDAVRHWLQYGRPPGTKGVLELQQEHLGKAGLAAPAQLDRAAEKGFPERPRERKTLGGVLPEGLRTALGLSVGQPVGQLRSAMEKGQMETGLPAATPVTVAVATATVPTVPAGVSAASAKMDAMLGSRAQLSKPQQLESTAAIQQPLAAPVARSAGQPTMEPARSAPQLSAFSAIPAEAPGAGLFRASQMPMLPAANPMALHLYQTLMAASLMGAGGQRPLQEGAPVHAMPQAMSPAINPNMLLGPALAPDGGHAAMAHLLAMRSEVMALHLSVKLFHCTPQELPEDAQEQLTAWLRQAPACTELYVRSGCVHLTITAYVDEATAMAAEEGGVLTAVKSLVQQPSDIWRKGSMLVTSMDNTVMVCDGVPQRVCALSSLCCGVSRAEPLVTMPGQLIALEVQKLPSATDPCTVLCRSRGSYWAIKAEALNSAGSSSLYGVRLPEDMPPGLIYLEVEQGAFVGGPCAVLVMPSQRFTAAAEVLQLMRGVATAATGLGPGGIGPAIAPQLAWGAFTQLGLWLKHCYAVPASRSAMAAPEETPSALLVPPQALQPLAAATMQANLLQLAVLWSMPNLAYMYMGGLSAQQLSEKQQRQSQGLQQPFSFPQTSMRAAPGYGWGAKSFQNPCQSQVASPSPLVLLADAVQLADCTA